MPGVRGVAQHAGRGRQARIPLGRIRANSKSICGLGLSGQEQEAAETRIRAVLANFPGVTLSLKTFLTERVEETVSGVTAAVTVGSIVPVSMRWTAQPAMSSANFREVPGAVGMQQRSPPGMPQVSVTLRPADLQRWGLDAVEVLELVRTAYQGDIVGQG